MQILPIYLYANKLDVTLDLDATIRGVNQVMYQRDLTIQKGIKNQIRVQFKNSDQKRISVSTSTLFVFTMFDAINQRTMLEKALEVLPETTTSKGMALLTLNESDTIDLDKSSYTYSVKQRDTDGTYTAAYANTYYGMNGTLHLSTDVYPVLQDSTTINTFIPSFNTQLSLYSYSSGNIYVYPEFKGNSGLHTMVFYMTAFKGIVNIYGTLNNSPASTPFSLITTFSLILSRTYDGTTSIDYVTFEGVYTYIRVAYRPDTGPIDPNSIFDPNLAGTFDKAVHRS